MPSIPNSEFAALRKLAVELMLKRQLPTDICKTLLAGYGNGSSCSLCGQPIGSTQVEYELTDVTLTRERVFLHLWCHDAWSMELAKGPG